MTQTIEQLTARVRELEEENARLKRTNSSYASLTKAQESQLTNLRQRLYQLKGADSAIDSERQANCELTEQLAAAQEEWNQCSGLLDDAHRSIEMLEDQLATAEQRIAEACAALCDHLQTNQQFGENGYGCEAAITRGEWRKHMKGE